MRQTRTKPAEIGWSGWPKPAGFRLIAGSIDTPTVAGRYYGVESWETYVRGLNCCTWSRSEMWMLLSSKNSE